MKCSHPHCNHGIGLVSHRRSSFTKARFCSKRCRDTYVVKRVRPVLPERAATTYFEWLFLQPAANVRPQLAPAVVRVRAR
jgi:hypothetical protein